jgi:hypothetical protein
MLNVHISRRINLSRGATTHELVVHPKCKVLCLTSASSTHLDNILTTIPRTMEVTHSLKMPHYCIFLAFILVGDDSYVP